MVFKQELSTSCRTGGGRGGERVEHTEWPGGMGDVEVQELCVCKRRSRSTRRRRMRCLRLTRRTDAVDGNVKDDAHM